MNYQCTICRFLYGGVARSDVWTFIWRHLKNNFVPIKFNNLKNMLSYLIEHSRRRLTLCGQTLTRLSALNHHHCSYPKIIKPTLSNMCFKSQSKSGSSCFRKHLWAVFFITVPLSSPCLQKDADCVCRLSSAIRKKIPKVYTRNQTEIRLR